MLKFVPFPVDPIFTPIQYAQLEIGNEIAKKLIELATKAKLDAALKFEEDENNSSRTYTVRSMVQKDEHCKCKDVEAWSGHAALLSGQTTSITINPTSEVELGVDYIDLKGKLSVTNLISYTLDQKPTGVGHFFPDDTKTSVGITYIPTGSGTAGGELGLKFDAQVVQLVNVVSQSVTVSADFPDDRYVVLTCP